MPEKLNCITTIALKKQVHSHAAPATIAFHKAVEKTNTYIVLDKKTRALVTAYLTTNATLADLRHLARNKSVSVLHTRITAGLTTMLKHMPPHLQKQYPNPKAVL